MSKTKHKRGLGDSIAAITEATGIKAAVDWFSDTTGIDCGCDKRQKRLNEVFPYKTPKCLNKQQYDDIKTLPRPAYSLNNREKNIVARVHADVFEHTFSLPCCDGAQYKQWINDLYKLADEYQD